MASVSTDEIDCREDFSFFFSFLLSSFMSHSFFFLPKIKRLLSVFMFTEIDTNNVVMI